MTGNNGGDARHTNGLVALAQVTYKNGNTEGFSVEKSWTAIPEIIANTLLKQLPDAWMVIMFNNKLEQVGVYYGS